MTDKEKLIQLIATGEQCNIDLGVYQWLAQGFDKTELYRFLAATLMTSNFWELGFHFLDFHIAGKSTPLGSNVFLFKNSKLIDRFFVKSPFVGFDFFFHYESIIKKAIDLHIKELAVTE